MEELSFPSKIPDQNSVTRFTDPHRLIICFSEDNIGNGKKQDHFLFNEWFDKAHACDLDPYSCEAVKLSDRPRQKGQTYTSRTLDPLIEIVSTTYYDCILYNDS